MTETVLAEVDRDMLAAFVAGDPPHVIAADFTVPVSQARAALQRLCGFDLARARELLDLPALATPPSLARPTAPVAKSASTPRPTKGHGPLVEPIRVSAPATSRPQQDPSRATEGRTVARDQPTFPILAQDALAPAILTAYRDLCTRLGLQGQALQVQLALDEMVLWQATNRDLVKLPDREHVPWAPGQRAAVSR